MKDGDGLNRRQVEVISGLAAGFSCTVVTHPLDLIKIRLQLSRGDTNNPLRSFYRTVKVINRATSDDFLSYKGDSRLLKAFRFPHAIKSYYRGLAPNLIGNITAWSLYFTSYAEFKGIVHTSSNTANYFIASSLAGITCTLITNPIWVLKTRILSTPRSSSNAYKSVLDGVSQISRNEGIRGFWKGTLPSMFSVLQGSLQFTFYDSLKSFLLHRSGNDRLTLSTQEYLYASITSRILSMVILYPSQMVKARLQNYVKNGESRTMSGTIKELWINEGGVKAFYKGMAANIIRVLPATCVTFLVYESVRTYLIDEESKRTDGRAMLG